MNRPQRQLVALACLSVAVLVALSRSAIAIAGADASAGAAACTAANTQVWLGVGTGGGFAGGQVLPLEFTNVGHRPCSLYGYPGVSAYRGALRQAGPAAIRTAGSPALVTLAPGATAHAALKITDTGAVCGRGAIAAAGLIVYPPGQRTRKTITLPLSVCARRAVLAVGPVRHGVGVPGYVTQ